MIVIMMFYMIIPGPICRIFSVLMCGLIVWIMIRNYNIGRVHLLHRDYGSCRRLAFSVQSYLWSIHIQYHRYDVFTKERSGANSHNED